MELEPEICDGLIRLEEARRMLRGRGGKPACAATLRRWANKRVGYRIRGRRVATLRTVKMSGTWLTHPKWIQEFDATREAAGQLDCASADF